VAGKEKGEGRQGEEKRRGRKLGGTGRRQEGKRRMMANRAHEPD
jgi:hypothetical protein